MKKKFWILWLVIAVAVIAWNGQRQCEVLYVGETQECLSTIETLMPDYVPAVTQELAAANSTSEYVTVVQSGGNLQVWERVYSPLVIRLFWIAKGELVLGLIWLITQGFLLWRGLKSLTKMNITLEGAAF